MLMDTKAKTSSITEIPHGLGLRERERERGDLWWSMVAVAALDSADGGWG